MKFNMGRLIKYLFIYIAAACIFMFTVFPILWDISSSLKGQLEIFSIPPTFIPKVITAENYTRTVNDSHLLTYVKNSVVVAVVTTFLTALISALAAYALALFNFKGKKTVYNSLVATQLLPGAVILIPLFIIFGSFKLLNSYSSLILANLAFTLPVAVIMLTGYFIGVPRELEESAKIDGCSSLQILFKILLPLVSPGITSVAIYTFVGVWQEFLFAVSLISDKEKYTLPVGITTFIGQHTTDWGGLMATSIVLSIPAVIVFLIAQRYFVDNLSGAVKG